MNQIKTALPPPPARVVDAGGGTGQVAVPLAGLGYELTVVDTSPAMLATCAERAAEEGGATLALVQGDAAEVAALLGPASQDAVLCHDLLGDVAEPAGRAAAATSPRRCACSTRTAAASPPRSSPGSTRPGSSRSRCSAWESSPPAPPTTSTVPRSPASPSWSAAWPAANPTGPAPTPCT